MKEVPTILVIVSAADRIPLVGGGSHPTGVFLGELVEPVAILRERGYRVAFASPGGQAPTIDQDSLRLVYWGFSRKRREQGKRVYRELLESGLDRPQEMEELAGDERSLEKYAAVFVPGGHAPMVDLLRDPHAPERFNESFGAILAHFHRHGKPTGLICHAVAALAAARNEDGSCLYHGYHATAVTSFSEWLVESFPLTKVINGHITEYPTQVLKDVGVILEQSYLPMKPKVVEDRELITGQDPYAARRFGRRFTDKLERARARE